jgi:hypothetical protein
MAPLRTPRTFWTLFACALTIDLLLIALHHVSVWGIAGSPAPGWLHAPRFRVDVDWGYAEMFGYFKLLVVVGLLLYLRASYGLSAVVWGLVFGYVLLDDAFSLHERYGAQLAGSLPSASLNLRPQDFGELLIWGGAGAMLGALVLIAYLRAGGAERRFSGALGGLFAVLVFFGAGVDLAHSAVFGMLLGQALGSGGVSLEPRLILTPAALTLLGSALPFGVRAAALYALLLLEGSTVASLQGLNIALTLLEDGGELVTLSAVLSFCACRAASRAPRADRRAR